MYLSFYKGGFFLACPLSLNKCSPFPKINLITATKFFTLYHHLLLNLSFAVKLMEYLLIWIGNIRVSVVMSQLQCPEAT